MRYKLHRENWAVHSLKKFLETPCPELISWLIGNLNNSSKNNLFDISRSFKNYSSYPDLRMCIAFHLNLWGVCVLCIRRCSNPGCRILIFKQSSKDPFRRLENYNTFTPNWLCVFRVTLVEITKLLVYARSILNMCVEVSKKCYIHQLSV